MSEISIESIEESWDLGLDGPYCERPENELSEKTKFALYRKFAKFDHVIGDNILWPAEFSRNFFFHGHFLWLDYYSMQEVSKEQNWKKRKNRDLINLELTKKFFFNNIFVIKSKFVRTDLVKNVPLMQIHTYPELKFPITNKKENATVWLAVGLTKSTSRKELSYLLDTVKSVGLTVQERETFNLNSFSKPSLVIGRPGMGTIRDIMNYGIDFIPINFKSDFELSHNVEVLLQNRLVRIEGSLRDRIVQCIDLPLTEEIKSFWNINSLAVSEYAALVLQNCNNA